MKLGGFNSSKQIHPIRRVLSMATLIVAMAGTQDSALASDQSSPVTANQAHVIASFNKLSGQSAENLTIDHDGTVLVSLAESGEVVRVNQTGTVTELGHLPLPPGGLITGIVITPDHRILVAAANSIVNQAGVPGSDKLTSALSTANTAGVWQLSPGPPSQLSAFPSGSMPNGMAIDPHDNSLYVSDSRQGTIWRVSALKGRPVPWIRAPILDPVRSVLPISPQGINWQSLSPNRTVLPVGANGIKLLNGEIYVGNTSTGTIYRIPITRKGDAGNPGLVGDHLGPIDDFTFLPKSSTIVAAQSTGFVIGFDPKRGTRGSVFPAATHFPTPTAVAATSDSLYVSNSGNFDLAGPNLLTAHIDSSTK